MRSWRTLVASLLLAATPTLAASPIATVDRTTIGEGETFRLMIEAPGQDVTEPDLTPLTASFDVIGTSRSTQISIADGQTDARTQFLITLAPKRPGEQRIPPLSVAGQETNAILITVIAARQGAGGEGSEIFLEAEVDPPDPYVQSQATYSVRLFHALDLREGSLSEPELEDAVVERIGDDVSFEATRDGNRYQVIERRYAIFPQTSGPLELPPPVFSGQVPDNERKSSLAELFGRRGGFSSDPFGSFFRPTRAVRAQGPAITLEVRPTPAAMAGKPWLPAESLILKETWASTPLEFRVGEPATRSLTLIARGLTGAQLPDLEFSSPASIKLYPDQPSTKTFTEGVHVIGRREFKVALVPQQAGEITLPEVRVDWWDTGADKQQVAVLPPKTITVLPSASAPATPEIEASPERGDAESLAISARSSGESGSPQSPSWLTLALLVAWLATAILWWLERRRYRFLEGAPAPPEEPAPKAPSLGQAKRALVLAGREKDAGRARDALLSMAASEWPNDPPPTLLALAERLDAEDARRLVLRLDAHLYRGTEGDIWDADALTRRMRNGLPRPRPQARAKSERLPELYAG